MTALRREPYRLFFPLALGVGWGGMAPWFAFGRGWIRAWPGFPHAVTMTQGFLLALIAGFLTTMIPRRAQVDPAPAALLVVLALLVVAIPVAAFSDALVLSEVAYAVALVLLGGFMARSFRRRTSGRPPPPSFVLVPFGLLLGVAGSILVVAFLRGWAAASALSLGRQLAQQGLMLSLVMAVVPMIGPILARGEAPPDPAPGRAALLRAAYALAGVLLAGSFLLETWVSARAGLLLRTAIVAIELVGAGRLLARAALPGLHRRLFKLALWLIVLGLAGAAGAPVGRIPALHVMFVGGFSLVALAVTVHVTLVHGGRDAEARGRPLLVALAAVLTIAAAVTRYLAERLPSHFFGALTLASALWLAAALAWAIYLGMRLSGRSGRPS